MWGSAKSPKQNKQKNQKPKTHLNNPPTSPSKRVHPVNKQTKMISFKCQVSVQNVFCIGLENYF